MDWGIHYIPRKPIIIKINTTSVGTLDIITTLIKLCNYMCIVVKDLLLHLG